MPTHNWLEKYLKEQKEAAARAKEYFAALVPSLKAAGAAKLVIHYDGSGDSGEIESMIAFNADDAEVTFTHDTDATDKAACDVLAGFDIDWYNNEGGFGDVILTVETGKVTVEHNQWIEDSIYKEYEA